MARKASAPRRERKPEFSPTKLRTYLECAAKYKFTYVERLSRYYARARAGYSFGTSLHRTLQEFHQAGGARALAVEDVVEKLSEGWVSAGYQDRAEEEERRQQATEIVAAYHRREAEAVVAADRAAEQGIALPVAETLWTERQLKKEYERFRLIGRIDRLDRHADGTLEIVDYKSGRLTTSEDEVRDDLAMAVYQLLVRHHHPDAPAVVASIFCLRSGEKATAMLDEQERAELEAGLTELIHGVLEQDWAEIRPVPCPACPDCDFLPLCERYWRRQEAARDSYEPA